MKSRWPMFGFLLGCMACSGKSERDEKSPALPVVPGTCVDTDCSWPTVGTREPATLVTCALTDGPSIEVEWNEKAAEVPCGTGQCFAVPSDLTVGANGEVWTTARLFESPVADLEHPIGVELRRNATSGGLELERATHTFQPADVVNAWGMSVGMNGELDWVGPSPNTTGLSLLHYDRSGNETSASWLIQHAVASTTHFGLHGITVVYRYASAVESSDLGEDADFNVGVARFDAKGSKVLWNQAFSHTGVPIDDIHLVGVASDGAVNVVLSRPSSWEQAGGALLVQLGTGGQVAWARELEGSSTTALGMNPIDDSLVLAEWLHDEASSVAMESIDSHGAAMWRQSFQGAYGLAMFVSGQGEIWLYTNGYTPEESRFIELDGTNCVRHPLQLSFALHVGTESWIDNLKFERMPNDRVAFASTGRYGVLALP